MTNEFFKDKIKYIAALGKSLIDLGFEINEGNLKQLFIKAESFLKEQFDSSDSDDEIEKKNLLIGNERSFTGDFIKATNKLKILVQKNKIRDLTNLILITLKQFLIQNQNLRKELTTSEQHILNKMEEGLSIDGIDLTKAPAFKKLEKDDLHKQKEQIQKSEKMMTDTSLEKFTQKMLPDILTAVASILLPDGWNKELAKSEKNMAYQREGKSYKAAQDEDRERFGFSKKATIRDEAESLRPDFTPHQDRVQSKKVTGFSREI